MSEVIDAIIKVVVLGYGSIFIMMFCLWPVNDKPVDKIHWLICAILISLLWRWMLCV